MQLICREEREGGEELQKQLQRLFNAEPQRIQRTATANYNGNYKLLLPQMDTDEAS